MPLPGDTAPAEGAPAEGAAPVEGEGAATELASGLDGNSPAEGEGAPVVEKTAEELAAEVEAKRVEDEKFAAELPALIEKIPEAERRKLGQKYANATMAAARRAERATDTVKAENATLKAQLAERGGAPDLRKDPKAAVSAAGFKSIREFIDHVVAIGQGGGDAKPDPLDEVAKLRAERDAERKQAQEQQAAAAHERDRANVDGFLKADATRWGRTATRTGQERLWAEIGAYGKLHGQVTNEAVTYLADQVERELRAEFGDPVPRAAAKGAQSTPASGAAGASSSAKAATITSRGAAGAPVVREYSLDPEIRRQQVNADMKAAKELRASAEG